MNKHHNGKKRQTEVYLSQAKEARLPHGLNKMAVLVLVIFTREDGRELLKSILGVFTKKDRAFSITRNLTCHQALASSMDR